MSDHSSPLGANGALLLGATNLALIGANVACLVAFVWAQYRRKVKYYDRSIRILEEEQGEWFVNFVVERELAKLFKHYTRDGADDASAPAGDVEGEEEYECECGEDPCGCSGAEVGGDPPRLCEDGDGGEKVEERGYANECACACHEGDGSDDGEGDEDDEDDEDDGGEGDEEDDGGEGDEGDEDDVDNEGHEVTPADSGGGEDGVDNEGHEVAPADGGGDALPVGAVGDQTAATGQDS